MGKVHQTMDSEQQQTPSPSDLEWLALPLHSQSVVKKGAVLTVNPNACKHQPAEAKPSSSHPSEGSFPALLHPTTPKHDKAPEPPPRTTPRQRQAPERRNQEVPDPAPSTSHQRKTPVNPSSHRAQRPSCALVFTCTDTERPFDTQIARLWDSPVSQQAQGITPRSPRQTTRC